MKFDFQWYDKDNKEKGGQVKISCATLEEVKDAYFAVGPKATDEQLFGAMQALTADELVEVTAGKESRPYFPVTVVLEEKWVAPYFDRLRRMTGYDGPVPDMVIPSLTQACPTILIEAAALEGGNLVVEGYDSASDWDGKLAHNLVDGYAKRSVLSKIASQQLASEFICVDEMRGLYKRNPNYGDGKFRPIPAVHSRQLWKAICDWWIDTEATPWQKQVIQQEREDQVIRSSDGYFGFYGESQHIFLKDHQEEGYMSREEFIRGGENVVAE